VVNNTKVYTHVGKLSFIKGCKKTEKMKIEKVKVVWGIKDRRNEILGKVKMGVNIC